MIRNTCMPFLAMLIATTFLTACEHTATLSKKRTLQEIAYLPIAANSNLELEFAGKPLPREVQDACRQFVPGAVGTFFLEWIADRLIGGVRERVAKELASYASEVTSEKTYIAFYDPEHWRPGDDAKTSCFAAVNRACELAAGSNDSRCDDSNESVNLLVIGQYRLTDQYLQLRPLWAGIKGMPGNFRTGATSSVALTLTLHTDWYTRSRGIRSTAAKLDLYQATFKASKEPQELPVTSVAWSELPYLPIPETSESIDDNGHVAPVLSLTAVSLPPKGVFWLSSFLDEKGKDLSKELRSSLEELLE